MLNPKQNKNKIQKNDSKIKLKIGREKKKETETSRSQKRKANEFKLLLNSPHEIRAHVKEMATGWAGVLPKRDSNWPQAKTDALFVVLHWRLAKVCAKAEGTGTYRSGQG